MVGNSTQSYNDGIAFEAEQFRPQFGAWRMACQARMKPVGSLQRLVGRVAPAGASTKTHPPHSWWPCRAVESPRAVETLSCGGLTTASMIGQKRRVPWLRDETIWFVLVLPNERRPPNANLRKTPDKLRGRL